jgi:hypothetical protein
MKRAIKYLHGAQFAHGGWIGSWGVCFTYGTWFALQGLALIGEYYHNSARVRKACHFLLDNQKDDGGWGESFKVGIVSLTVLLLLLIALPISPAAQRYTYNIHVQTWLRPRGLRWP